MSKITNDQNFESENWDIVERVSAPIFEKWTRFNNDDSAFKSGTQFNHYELIEEDDFLIADNTQSINDEHCYLRKYAAGEFLAHELAYKDELLNAYTPTSLEILEENGAYSLYECARIQVSHEGLVGYILVPTTLPEHENPEIKVVFRGTKSKASLARDLEFGGGPGAVSFAENSELLLEQIAKTIKEFNVKNKNQKPINLTFAGHSLGASDAQNAIYSTMRLMCDHRASIESNLSVGNSVLDSGVSGVFDQVRKLKLFTYNSPGVPKDIELGSNLFAEKISKFDEKNRIQIESYNQIVHGDGVQQTGEGHVLSNVPQNVAVVDVLKANIGCGGRHQISLPIAAAMGAASVAAGVGVALPAAVIATSAAFGALDTNNAHRTHLYQSPLEVSYKRMSNATPEGQAEVRKELSNKSWVINAIQNGIGHFFDYKRNENKCSKDQKTKNLSKNDSVLSKEGSTPRKKTFFSSIFG